MTEKLDELNTIFAIPDAATKDAALEAFVKRIQTESFDNGKSQSGGLMNMFSAQSPSAKDPVEVMREVLRDPLYTDEAKSVLFFMSRERFQNRRKMAYISLSLLVVSTVLIAGAFLSDGVNYTANYSECVKNISGALAATKAEGAPTQASEILSVCNEARFLFTTIFKENQYLLTWIGSFFTSIIALYYGAASFRPTS